MTLEPTTLDQAVALARQFGATRLILFGSAGYSLREARDVDLACEGVEGWKLYELAARLEEVIGAPMDLVPLTPPTRFTRYIEAHGRRLL